MTHQREAPAANGSGSRLRYRTLRPWSGAPQPPASDAVVNAVNAAAPEHKGDVASAAATAAVNAAPPGDKGDVASAAVVKAVNAATREDKADVATAAAAAAVNALPSSTRQEVLDRLVPDQQATNRIWLWIVITFAIVLGGSIVALISTILISAWRKIDPADVQVLLTVVTTIAGILAGFIGGRASKSTG